MVLAPSFKEHSGDWLQASGAHFTRPTKRGMDWCKSCSVPPDTWMGTEWVDADYAQPLLLVEASQSAWRCDSCRETKAADVVHAKRQRNESGASAMSQRKIFKVAGSRRL